MDDAGVARQVWVFLKESDQWQHRPLFLALLDLLRREGIAGATVLHGIAGYGMHRHIHTSMLVELASDLPIVVTFVDRADRVDRVLPLIVPMLEGGLISVTSTTVVAAAHHAPGPFPSHLVVADVMTRDVVQARPDTPLSEVVALLIDRALRALPVVDAERRVVGIVTDGDLLTRGAIDLPLDLQRALPLFERAAQVAPLVDRPECAAEVMTSDPLTISSHTPLAQAAATMAAHDLKRLLVVDEQGRLVGMVSRSDLLATVVEGLRQHPAEPLRLPAGAPRTIGEMAIYDVPTVRPDTSLAETLDRLLETDRRRVVVVEGDRVVGIITDGDVIRRAGRRVRPGVLRALAAWFGGGGRPDELEVVTRGRIAADVMTSQVVMVTTDTPISEAIRLIIDHRVKRLPVVDGEGRLVGLVGRAGVLAALIHR